MTRKPAMPARTLKALKASIEKWRKNEEGDYQGMFTDSCPLCRLFNADVNLDVDGNDNCRGCPVFEKTGREDCVGSPWIEAYDAFFNAGWQRSPQFLAASKKERIFLESLLPKEARK